jgi:hypothetical protein
MGGGSDYTRRRDFDGLGLRGLGLCLGLAVLANNGY